jgi:hypothetical protein
MIEQQGSKLTLTFPSKASATTFAAFLATLLQPSPSEAPASDVVSVPPSELSPEIMPAAGQGPILDSPEPVSFRSRRIVLTPERQDQLFNQRQSGQTAHDRLLRAQTTLRDGVLPFSRPGQAPQPTGQPSPRQRAAAEGGFADGVPGVWPEAGRRSRLRPVLPPYSQKP